MSEQISTILVGLPGSGKTSFIAALWHILNEKKHSLKLNIRQSDRKYLEEIHAKWAVFEEIERSNTGTFYSIELDIIKDDSKVLKLNFPDVSGELYKDIYDSRTISSNLSKKMMNTNSILLFIHPNSLKVDRYIGDVVKPNEIDEAHVEEQDLSNLTNFEISQSQAIITDLIIALKNRNKIKNIAVIVSAWDTIKDFTPEKYIKESCPLFHMFLKNSGIKYKIWGVSAQGGDYKNNQDMRQIQEYEDLTERIRIVDCEGENNDISLPLNWLIEQNEN
ncbi:TRAFAC clade GTPase domain-containing protein [Dysgonomonas termitidis]|uniref:Double-GTPase 1 domain-containing protein n=1 Tax=Dysgonomonas termitidis TaxID=1516126 RepID=A0ABV9KXC3_9BACT